MRRSLLATATVTAAAVATAISLATAVLCGPAGADPVEPLGYLRVLHGDLGVAGRPVAVAVDGQPAGQAPWAGASPWRPVPPGRHRITATGGTDATVDVGAGCGVTLATGQASLDPASRRVVIVPDCNPPRIGPGQARITAVVVTSPSFGAVDVTVNGGSLRVEPHTAVPGGVVRAGALHVVIRDPKTAAVFVQRDAQLPEGTSATLALVGGGEAGVTLAVVEDAAQARAVPAPGQAIHTGPSGPGLVPVAAVVGAALAALAVWAARRPQACAGVLVAGALLLAGCTAGDRTVVRPAVDQSPTPNTPPVAPSPGGTTSPNGAPAPPPPRRAPGPPVATPTPNTQPDGRTAAGVGPDAAAFGSPVSLRITSLGLDLPVGRLDGVDGLPRSLPLPQVAWLTGTSPAGAAGTTAIVGHTGRGPFGRLGAVRPGDEITVTDHAGRAHTYRTVSVSTHHKEAFPQDVWAPQRLPTLVLITCTGGTDPKSRLHVDNLVVRAVAV